MKFNFDKKEIKKQEGDIKIKLIPIISSEENLYSLAEDPELKKQDLIYRIQIRNLFFGNERSVGYFLRHDISEHKYLFRLVKNSEHDYFGFAFKTENYEYSKTQLDQDENKDLLETITNFIESVHKDSGMDKIYLSPHTADYSVDDINECADILLKTSHYKDYTKEQLLKEYRGIDIFREFHYLFPDSEKFQFDSYKNLARKRWFEISFKKYLKGWHTENVEGIKSDFFLIRNKKQNL
jgi:hypothetical protein